MSSSHVMLWLVEKNDWCFENVSNILIFNDKNVSNGLIFSAVDICSLLQSYWKSLIRAIAAVLKMMFSLYFHKNKNVFHNPALRKINS